MPVLCDLFDQDTGRASATQCKIFSFVCHWLCQCSSFFEFKTLAEPVPHNQNWLDPICDFAFWAESFAACLTPFSLATICFCVAAI